MRGFLIIIVLALLSGTVAYIGDIVGRRAGKRRIALGKLRPRQVGAYFAVFTGVFIALVTFLVLTLSSMDVRTWVYEYDQLQTKVKDLNTQIEVATQSSKAMKERYENLSLDLSDKESELIDVEGDLEETKTEFSQLSGELDMKTAKLGELESRLGENRVKLAALEGTLSKAVKELNHLSSEVETLTGENSTLRESRENLVSEISMLETEASELNKENDALSMEQEALEMEIGELRRKNVLIGANQPLAYIGIEREWTGREVREAILTTLALLKQKLASKGYKFEEVHAAEIEALLSGLSGAETNKVIIVSSAVNVVSEEPVEVRYTVIDNRLCFKKDEIIVDFLIPGDASIGEVEELFALAIRNMRAKADRLALLPDIDTGSVGSLNYDEIRRMILKISRDVRGYSVHFVSSEDVYRLGNLDNLIIRDWPVN